MSVLQNNKISAITDETFCKGNTSYYIRANMDQVRLDGNPISLSKHPNSFICLHTLPVGWYNWKDQSRLLMEVNLELGLGRSGVLCKMQNEDAQIIKMTCKKTVLTLHFILLNISYCSRKKSFNYIFLLHIWYCVPALNTYVQSHPRCLQTFVIFYVGWDHFISVGDLT